MTNPNPNSTGITITLELTTQPRYTITNPHTLTHAITTATDRARNGDPGDDPGAHYHHPAVLLRAVDTDSHRIDFTYTLDWDGPRDDNGRHQWLCEAHQGARKLAEGHDPATVADHALAELGAHAWREELASPQQAAPLEPAPTATGATA